MAGYFRSSRKIRRPHTEVISTRQAVINYNNVILGKMPARRALSSVNAPVFAFFFFFFLKKKKKKKKKKIVLIKAMILLKVLFSPVTKSDKTGVSTGCQELAGAYTAFFANGHKATNDTH